jgi:hypothetical protein
VTFFLYAFITYSLCKGVINVLKNESCNRIRERRTGTHKIKALPNQFCFSFIQVFLSLFGQRLKIIFEMGCTSVPPQVLL